MIETSTAQVLSVLIIVVTLVLIAVLQRGRFTLRRITAYEQMPQLAGLSIESNRPMHLSIGGTGLGGESTLLAIATAELANQIVRRLAIGDVPPILTLSNTSALPLGQDTLRRAYASRGMLDRYRATSVRWYPSGTRSLAFAAALNVMLADDDVSSTVMAGSYGPELALIMDGSYKRGVPIIATSDQLEGQAVAFALSTDTLIGEEVFAANGYLSGDGSQTTEAAVIDFLRWMVIAVILIGMVVTAIGD